MKARMKEKRCAAHRAPGITSSDLRLATLSALHPGAAAGHQLLDLLAGGH
jgi:hypothetical protein